MDIFSERSIRALLARHDFRFTKAMGQNFLTDADVPEKIAEGSGVDGSFGVLEIGPGIGALTRSLSRRAGAVLAVELDRRLLPLLDETLAGCDNVRLITGDILKLDIAETVLRELPGLRHAACANLPYNITTPVLTALLEAGVFESITVMVQREVARRICASPGTADYGAFTVFVRYHAEPEALFDVLPEKFIPRPKVVSSVLRLAVRAERPPGIIDEKLFFRVVRGAFAQRRKTLVNSLGAAFGGAVDKQAIKDIVARCGHGETVRGETLGIEEFAALARGLSEVLK